MCERATASEPRERSAPAKRRARERVGESEGRSPSDENGARRRSGARESVSGSPRGEAPRMKTERAGAAARERACRGVRGAKPLGSKRIEAVSETCQAVVGEVDPASVLVPQDALDLQNVGTGRFLQGGGELRR